MAGVVEEIFRIKSDTAQVLSQIQQLKGVFTELTEEQKKQVTQLAILEQKEKDLIKARNASTNPTTQIRINKELNENIKQLGFLKEAVDKFAKSETVARVEADALSKSVSNAFKQTQVGGATKQIEQLGKQAAGATKSGFNPLNNSLNQLSRELPAFAVSANVGFLAISNNLPIFFDAIERTKKINSELQANGQKTTSVLSQLGSALFSMSSLLSIGVTLLTIYGAKIAEWAVALFEGEKALESITKANEKYNESIQKTKEDITDLTIQLKVQTGLLTEQEGKLLKNENQRTKALNENKKLRAESIKALKEELGITDKILANYGKTRTFVTQGGEVKTASLNSGGDEKAAKRFYEVLKQINSENKLSNDYINEKYNIQGKIIKQDKQSNKHHKEKNKQLEKEIDLSDRIRQLQIDDIKVEQERERKQAEFDTERAIRDMKLLKATGEQKTALEIALNNDLVNKLEAIDKKYRDKQDDESRAQAKETGEAMNAVLEDNANTEIFLLEKKISKLKSKNKKANKDEIKELQDTINKKKFLLLNLQESEEIANLKQSEDGKVNLAQQEEIHVKYTNKRKKLQAEIDDSVKTSTTTAREEMLKQIGYFQGLEKAIIDATNQILAIKIKEVDGQIEQQQRRVDEAKNIADRGNAELLELEQKRLDDLTKKKAKFVKDQQALAAVELIANTAIAVSKAAAAGGPAAGVTIAAALIALVAGLASARSIASQAAFYDGGLYDEKGGYTGDGNPTHESKAFRKPYIHHKQEVIISHKPTRKFKDILLDINDGKVDLNEWKNKVSMYDAVFNGKQPFNLTNPYMNHPQVTNIIQFKQMEAKMDEMNRTLGALKLGLNVDEDGFTTFIQKRVDRKNLIKNAAKL